MPFGDWPTVASRISSCPAQQTEQSNCGTQRRKTPASALSTQTEVRRRRRGRHRGRHRGTARWEKTITFVRLCAEHGIPTSVDFNGCDPAHMVASFNSGDVVVYDLETSQSALVLKGQGDSSKTSTVNKRVSLSHSDDVIMIMSCLLLKHYQGQITSTK